MSNSNPHYIGHRQRLRDRFVRAGFEGLNDYEVVELLLTLAIPRSDVKEPAKELINRFGNRFAVIDRRYSMQPANPAFRTCWAARHNGRSRHPAHCPGTSLQRRKPKVFFRRSHCCIEYSRPASRSGARSFQRPVRSLYTDIQK